MHSYAQGLYLRLFEKILALVMKKYWSSAHFCSISPREKEVACDYSANAHTAFLLCGAAKGLTSLSIGSVCRKIWPRGIWANIKKMMQQRQIEFGLWLKYFYVNRYPQGSKLKIGRVKKSFKGTNCLKKDI